MVEATSYANPGIRKEARVAVQSISHPERVALYRVTKARAQTHLALEQRLSMLRAPSVLNVGTDRLMRHGVDSRARYRFEVLDDVGPESIRPAQEVAFPIDHPGQVIVTGSLG